jgi:hypothetical protein
LSWLGWATALRHEAGARVKGGVERGGEVGSVSIVSSWVVRSIGHVLGAEYTFAVGFSSSHALIQVMARMVLIFTSRLHPTSDSPSALHLTPKHEPTICIRIRIHPITNEGEVRVMAQPL